MGQMNRRTVRDLRRGNRSTLLRQLYFQGPVSRQELGTLTGLSSGSVSNVVGELLADGLVEEAGSVESDGGRPRTLLRVAPGSGHLIGVDVGETHVRVELFDLTLTELARWEHPLTPGGLEREPEPVVGHILTGLDAVVAKSGAEPGKVIGVGVGVPGVVEQGDEALVHGPTAGRDAVPLERLLRTGTELPLFIDNGATAQGQAEMWFGAGRGADNAVIALIGSGVGAAIVTAGMPYRGATSSAGEWGHTVVQVGGRACRCGAVGCLEAYVGAQAVLDRYGRRAGGVYGGAEGDAAAAGVGAGAGAGAGVGVGVGACLGAGEDQQAAFAAIVGAAGTEARAREVLEETAAYLGAGIADLINLFNPERIILGGWAGLLLGGRMLPRIRAATAAYALHRPYAQTEIGLAELGPDAVALGAATLPLAHFLATGRAR
ncbi:ROK family protein [Streptomyces sp. SID8361]|uniref:ROK family transcriptional regulator n=1 Tax=Streptomyces sp. MnatMP-M27 TaxID=1839768 RepID=UPI00081E6B76|nr:ROK family transcriptional regulator [Streptomyces sp. MnatMP-M27]MYU17434.1 ROK family protein [Streptomyces sp. SID8361]SCG11987.1 Sugar kinase of the NBD/HSP70 family, may contain an N-terminal HTH domain [Streptomyces sp. MnatMP-M27]